MDRRTEYVLLGAVVGALVGGVIGQMVAERVQALEEEGKPARLRATPMDWLKLIVAIVGAGRQLSQLLEPDEE